ncbi:hypothetical protein [Microbacterium aurum]
MAVIFADGDGRHVPDPAVSRWPRSRRHGPSSCYQPQRDGGAAIPLADDALPVRVPLAERTLVVLYVNQNTRNPHVSLRAALGLFPSTTAESDKMYMTTNQFVKAYDVAFVAGEAARRRWRGCSGRPTLTPAR